MGEEKRFPRWLIVTLVIVAFAGLVLFMLMPVYAWPQPEPIRIDIPMP